LVFVVAGVVGDGFGGAKVVGMEEERFFAGRRGAGQETDRFGDEVAPGGEAEMLFEGAGAREGSFVELGGEVLGGGGVATDDTGAVGGVVELDRGRRV
jgi:hypothetical protein